MANDGFDTVDIREGHEEATLDRQVFADFRLGLGDGAADFAQVLIDQFLAEAATQVGSIGEAIRRLDRPVLKTVAHKLSGSSAMLGARRLATLCRGLEAGALESGGTALVELASEIDQEFVKVQFALKAERQGMSHL